MNDQAFRMCKGNFTSSHLAVLESKSGLILSDTKRSMNLAPSVSVAYSASGPDEFPANSDSIIIGTYQALT